MILIGKVLKQMNFLLIGKKRRMNKLRKLFCMTMAGILSFNLICINAGAIGTKNISVEGFEQSTIISVLATGSFNLSVAAYGKSEGNKSFPLEAGESVKISAVYTPENASMDFGLVDPDGVFHYFNVTNGSVNKTIRVNKNGNYIFAVRNNSEQTVKVSGFVKY